MGRNRLAYSWRVLVDDFADDGRRAEWCLLGRVVVVDVDDEHLGWGFLAIVVGDEILALVAGEASAEAALAPDFGFHGAVLKRVVAGRRRGVGSGRPGG